MMAVIHLALLLGTCMCITQGALTLSSQSLRKDASSTSTEGFSIKQVIDLITKMQASCEAEAKADLEAHDKKMCYCETMIAKKSGSISEGGNAVNKFDNKVGEALGRIARLKTQIESLKKEIAETTETLRQLQLQRYDDHISFTKEELELKETRSLLKDAIRILSQVQFVQRGKRGSLRNHAATKTAFVQIQHIVKHAKDTNRFSKFSGAMQQDLFDLLGALEPPAPPDTSWADGSNLLQAAPDTKPNDLEGGVAGAKSYNPRSGQIYGMLTAMQDECNKDLAAAREKEATQEAQFQKMKSTILDDLESYNDQLDAKEAELAELTKDADDAKDGSEDTSEDMQKDKVFLAALRKSCEKAAKEYEERAQVRADELKALGETLEILTEEDARALFAKTLSFVQLRSGSGDLHSKAKLRQLRKAVSQKISKIAAEHHSQKLALLATSMKLDPFTKVKDALDQMYAELKEQQKQEYDDMEQCKKDIAKTEGKLDTLGHKKEDLETEMTNIEGKMKESNTGISALEAEVAELKSVLKKAGEDRTAEKNTFETSLSDQRATAQILKKALVKLESFYGASPIGLIQMHRQAPAASRDGGVVLVKLSSIIKDAEREEKVMIATETEAQEEYEALVADTDSSIKSKNSLIAEMQEELARAEAAKSDTEEAMISNSQEIDKVTDLLTAHHASCDWLMKNYDIRQKARSEEMEAVMDAKGVLSGSTVAGVS